MLIIITAVKKMAIFISAAPFDIRIVMGGSDMVQDTVGSDAHPAEAVSHARASPRHRRAHGINMNPGVFDYTPVTWPQYLYHSLS